MANPRWLRARYHWVILPAVLGRTSQRWATICAEQEVPQRPRCGGFLVDQPAHAVCQSRIVHQEHASQTGGKRLAPLSRHESEGPEGAAKAAVDPRAKRMATVFNQGNSPRVGPALHRRHVARNAIRVLDDQRRNVVRSDGFQPVGVDIVGVGVDVRIGRLETGELHGGGHDHARVAGHEHGGAAGQAEGAQTDVQSHPSLGQKKATAVAQEGFQPAAERLRWRVVHGIRSPGDGDLPLADHRNTFAANQEVQRSLQGSQSIGEMERDEHQGKQHAAGRPCWKMASNE